MAVHDIQAIEADLGLRCPQGRGMGLQKLERLEQELNALDRQLKSPAIPFDLMKCRRRVTDARCVSREAFRAQEILLKFSAGACAVHADEMNRLESKIYWAERAALVRECCHDIAPHPADRALGAVDEEYTGVPCEYFSWAEEMLLAFNLDAADNAIYDAYAELRPSALSGDIPLWAFRTAVQRRAGKCNVETR